MKQFITLICIFISLGAFSQNTLKDVLKKYNSESVPYITVDTLKKVIHKGVILLDAREKKEFKISHLKGAQFVGYEKFNLKKTTKSIANKDAKIVVYCSLGVRSEDIAEQLKNAGYTNVFNLYGGIFEWKNKENKVYNPKGKETEEIHAFSKEWAVWLLKGKKVY
ncbi:rhodanese-like domain-containing protein [Pseudotenacibaculum sp. MALMAid0570]|uniref:rhodanese-like domain-containing protein n=1 Tax=Pseudotenacibaculum sp. MALMAid0570 TaxID=3143938 RepID=UPI0032DFF8FB